MNLRLCLCVLLLAFVIPSCCQGMEASDVGVRLCGRDFIRTVVMSCGGSRWKRYSPEPGQERSNPNRDFLNWLNRASLEDPDRLNSLYADSHIAPNPPYGALQKDDPTMDQLHGALYDPLVAEEQQGVGLRMKRSAGPALSCCQRGCTKNELMKFC
ncbi:PREDICTED: insulin-like 3 [Nanorana parkeri]|uniref:insulin-like 3 n=1 Tax=Nanorana parkeri TaxID=125878 RepID=UPI0008540DBA|nr:PREDICTED: insulin-like 3 [Nanorana parkeri]